MLHVVDDAEGIPIAVFQGDVVRRTQTCQKRKGCCAVYVYGDPTPLIQIAPVCHKGEGMHAGARIATTFAATWIVLTSHSKPSGVPFGSGALISVIAKAGSNRLY